MTWHLIETAPKDGVSVLLYCESTAPTVQVGYFSSGAWRLEDRIVEPTHWQPLPEPPIGASSVEPTIALRECEPSGTMFTMACSPNQGVA